MQEGDLCLYTSEWAMMVKEMWSRRNVFPDLNSAAERNFNFEVAVPPAEPKCFHGAYYPSHGIAPENQWSMKI